MTIRKRKEKRALQDLLQRLRTDSPLYVVAHAELQELNGHSPILTYDKQTDPVRALAAAQRDREISELLYLTYNKAPAPQMKMPEPTRNWVMRLSKLAIAVHDAK